MAVKAKKLRFKKHVLMTLSRDDVECWLRGMTIKHPFSARKVTPQRLKKAAKMLTETLQESENVTEWMDEIFNEVFIKKQESK